MSPSLHTSLISGRIAHWLSGLIPYLVAALLAAGGGLLAVTGSPMIVAPVAGAILGVILLRMPVATIWMVLIGALVVSGLLQLFLPDLARLRWLVIILGFFLGLMAFLHMVLRREASVMPGYLWLALGFIVYSVLAAFANQTPVDEVAAGFKRYFQSWGLMFALALIPLAMCQVQRMVKFMLWLALLQIPFVIYQYIYLVPLRQMAGGNLGMVPIDVVAGTFGASLEGGGSSGELAAFLIVVMGFLVALWKYGLLTKARLLLLIALTLLPILLTEAKIAVVYLLVLGLYAFRNDILRRPAFAIAGLMSFLIVFGLVAWVYAVFYSKGMTFDAWMEDTIAYNFGEQGLGGFALNRTTALTFWWQQHGVNNLLPMIFGHGIGGSYSGLGGFVSGHVDAAYAGMGIGLTAMSTLLWDVGLFGVLLILAMFFHAWRVATQLELTAHEPWVKAHAHGLQLAMIITVISLLYRDSFTVHQGASALIAFCIGYLAILQRHGRKEVMATQ